MNGKVRPSTVKLIDRLLKAMVDEGIVLESERREVTANLKYLAAHGTLIPPVLPRLVDQREAADMLGISFANFKKMERDGAFPFSRKMVGSSVRFRNTDITKFILSDDGETPTANG